MWEGSVLIIGGIWLVGRMSRKSASHPINSVPQAILQNNSVNLTDTTNTAGSDSLVAGEPLSFPTPPIPTRSVPVASPVKSLPTRAPIHNNLAYANQFPRPVASGRSGASPVSSFTEL